MRGEHWGTLPPGMVCRDHPHMRGEHPSPPVRRCMDEGSSPHARGTLNVIESKYVTSGSSPHARGTQGAPQPFMVSHGIIPACAGNTCPACSFLTPTGDHPRMRGEHPRQIRTPLSLTGSSPHARGNTSPSSAWKASPGDHPRMRGEHTLARGTRVHQTGSSPHARGTQGAVGNGRNPNGIIPACAGNTIGRGLPR